MQYLINRPNQRNLWVRLEKHSQNQNPVAELSQHLKNTHHAVKVANILHKSELRINRIVCESAYIHEYKLELNLNTGQLGKI